MKNLLSAICILLTWTSCAHSQAPKLRQGCEILSNLQFNDGVDTILVLGYKLASIKPPPYDDVLSALDHKKKLNKHIFNYLVQFKPIGCDTAFIALCSDPTKFAFDVGRTTYNKPVRIRCIVYEKYTLLSHRYFVVDKIIPNE